MLFNENRLFALMDRFALDGIVASIPENILYLSGFSSWRQINYRHGKSQVYVVFPRDRSQSPALLIAEGDVEYLSHQDAWLKEIFKYGRQRKPQFPVEADLSPEEKKFLTLVDSAPKGPEPVAALAQVILEKGLKRSRVGIDHLGIPSGDWEKLASLLPGAELLPASDFFLYLRMVKTGAEIERLRQAARLNQQAATAVLKHAQSGVSEGELVAAYREEVGRAGGQVGWIHLAAGRGGNFPPLKDRVLTKGDVLRMDMGCRLQGYHADTCRSGCIGAPGEKQRKIFAALQAGVLKSVEQIKPAALPSELFETMIQEVRAAGLPDYSNFFVGHTIGLEAREFPFALGPAQYLNAPFLPSTTDVPLEPGMVANLEASKHELGWGSVSVEYTLVVTEDGYEHLIPPDQALYGLPLDPEMFK